MRRELRVSTGAAGFSRRTGASSQTRLGGKRAEVTGTKCKTVFSSAAATIRTIVTYQGRKERGARTAVIGQAGGMASTLTNGPSERAELVARACRLIEEAEEPPALADLATAVGLSRHHFHRVFTAETGVTPKAYGEAHRARRLRDHLDDGASITDAVHAAGFASSGRFYATSTARMGMTPGRFRRGGAGTRMRFAVGQCSLGAILVAATDRGVCAIELGDDPDDLVRSFQDRFHQAELIGADPTFEALVARVVGLVERPEGPSDLPLDVQGTAFQERVWRALRDIPAGTTTTYAGLAAAIGSPTAVRAVAGACAANKLAVAIPCHRVVRTDGNLSGYRWGVERKRSLLEREAAARVG
jgi:AraC family transcriptional regulator, regulatory protein of adaptative response / methylated-DNA-[protein]-cysteine methyltransferase